MSISAIGDIMRCGPIFKGAEKAVLLALANYADENGLCRPSINEIAWNTGLASRTVERALPELEDLLVLEVFEKGGGRRANRYRLNIDWLQKAAASIYRTKQQALQEGGNRYDKMQLIATAIRAELDREAAPRRLARKRVRETSSGRGKTHSAVNTPDTGSVLTPDITSGVETSKKTCSGADVGAPPTSRRLPPTQSRGTPDVMSPEPLIDSNTDPSIERVQAASDSQEPIRSRALPGRRLGEKGGEVEAKHTPQTLACAESWRLTHKPVEHRQRLPKRQSSGVGEEARDALSAIEGLAKVLQMRQHQICIRLGSLTLAADLARRWSDGDIALDAIRAKMEEIDPLDDSDHDDLPLASAVG
ncbi:MAG: helix-turn-helix domain-containing protein [Alphaproteobacteria bacterium]|nr:helix-turn-helix domain-containing protein [Alphaproteobacteria bacterium]